MAQTIVKLNKLPRTYTVIVTVSTEFKIRKFIALKLIKLAVIILGCRLEVVDSQARPAADHGCYGATAPDIAPV